MNQDYDYLFKILLLGDSGVGKSSIILRYTENHFSNNLMNSIGVDFKLKNIEIDDKKIKLQIWDTAGQERFRTITTSYYKGAQAIVIVYDVTDKDTFDHVKNWMVDIDKFAKENVLKFLVGNKCDLEHKRVVTFEQGKDLGKDSINSTADKYGIKFLETSAKDTVNINEIFVISTRTFLEKQIGTSTKGNRKTIGTGSISIETENENRKTNNKRKCC